MVKVGKVNFTPEQKKRTLHLPIEQAVFVPSTSGVKAQKRISEPQLKKRVNNVRRFLSQRFGGFTSVKTVGGFILKKDEDNPKEKGRLVREKVVKVTAFATKKSFKRFRPEVIKQIGTWGKKWKQQSVSYSNEGDLFIINPPKNGKPKVVMKVTKGRLVKIKTPRARTRTLTTAQRRVMLRNLIKARRSRKR